MDLACLRALPEAQAEAALGKLASLRSVMLGLPLRCNTAWAPDCVRVLQSVEEAGGFVYELCCADAMLSIHFARGCQLAGWHPDRLEGAASDMPDWRL